MISAQSLSLWPGIAGGLLLFGMVVTGRSDDSQLQLGLRSRVKTNDNAKTEFAVVNKKAAWEPKKTALIICDMWDDHWCQSASRRVAELAGPMNEVVKAARAKGVFIIHSPSSVVAFYKETPQRKRAQNAPFAKSPVPLATAERWGTACWWNSFRKNVWRWRF